MHDGSFHRHACRHPSCFSGPTPNCWPLLWSHWVGVGAGRIAATVQALFICICHAQDPAQTCTFQALLPPSVLLLLGLNHSGTTCVPFGQTNVGVGRIAATVQALLPHNAVMPFQVGDGGRESTEHAVHIQGHSLSHSCCGESRRALSREFHRRYNCSCLVAGIETYSCSLICCS